MWLFKPLLKPKNLTRWVGLIFMAGLFSLSSQAQDPLNLENDTKNRFKLGPSLDEFLEESDEKTEEEPKIDGFNQENWNKIRQEIEAGKTPGVEPEVEISTEPVDAPKPPPGQLNVQLPYESSLSITGRKLIRVELKNTHITQERAEELGTTQDSQSFSMEQELQARIQGTVARKTTINVNFDDTKDNVRDFSVIYKGDPDEVVQEAAFGDIVLSLPSTEFVNYNKQLFGIRAALKYKRAELLMIGSRTKGNTETKRFTGTTRRQQVFVNDTNYIRRKFYDLTFSRNAGMTAAIGANTILPISDSVSEIVYLQDNTTDPQIVNRVIAVSTSPSQTVTIPMRTLSRGLDYSIDRVEGVITFNRIVPEDAYVAIDFTLANGTRLSSIAQAQGAAGAEAVSIKFPLGLTGESPDEIKRYYSANARNIVRDNGLGNFVFRVLDQNRETEIGDNLTPAQRYPDNIEMDFDQGIIQLENRLSFSDVYDENVTAGAALHAVFSLEYNSVIRTFTLRPNIVLQSETVEVDGRRVTRDIDYFIDYDIGIITFFNDDLIRESTVIEVTYEFAPFGGSLGETLVGARGTFDVLQNQKVGGIEMENWKVGSTVLYNFAAKPTGPPDIRSAPSSLLVTEGDTQVEGLKFWNLPITTDFSMEKAKSTEDPNIFGKAVVETFEGIKQEDSASLIEESWAVAANPQFSNSSGTYNSISDFRGEENPQSHLQWNDVDTGTFDPNDGDTTQKALQIQYRLNPSTANSTIPEQVSIVQSLSFSGRDFSKKSTLEIEVEGPGANGDGVDMIVEIGSFNEDADGDGSLDTEDQIPLDGILNLGEDTGWQFNGPGDDLSLSLTSDNTITAVGQSNTFLDSEDLNRDQILNTTDRPATFSPVFQLSDGHAAVASDGSSVNVSDLNFSGRRRFTIELNISSLSDEEKARLEAVRQVRVTLRNLNPPSTGRSGSLLLTKLSVVGISWEPAELTGNTATSTMTVRAVNSKDDAESYFSLIGNPDFNSLYDGVQPDSDAREQALAFDYDLDTNSTGTSKNAFGVTRDYSDHKVLKFFLRKRDSDGACAVTSTCGIFFLQAGSETEYQQASINVQNIPFNTWKTVNIAQKDLNRDGTPETWESLDPDVTITRVGNVPDLSQVSQLKAGIYNDSGTTRAQNQVWLNDIHMSESNEREGYADKIAFDTTWTNWMSFGASRREVDRHFQTPTTQITNQDRLQESLYLNVDRLNFLPMTFKRDRDETVTPNAFRSNSNALVSFIEEGRVENERNSATAKLIIPKLPIFDFALKHNTADNTVTQRGETADSIRVGATYSPPVDLDLVPGKKLSLNIMPKSITVSHTKSETELRFPDSGTLQFFGISTTPFSSTNLTQFSEDSEVRLAFRPWNGFTFNPTYKLRTEEEQRDFRDEEITSAPNASLIDGIRTPRSLSQTISASGNLRLLKWFEPRYNYSITGTETNGLPTLTETTAYAKKTIRRSSQGELSAAIQMSRVIPSSVLFRTFNVNGSYKIETGDGYEDVPEGFDWRGKLWGATPLEVSSGTTGRRTELTDRRTFRANTSWLPLSGYQISSERLRPLSSLSLTSNFLTSTEDSEITGTSKRVESRTFPDLILTINDVEEFFNVDSVLDESRLVVRTNLRTVDTINVSEAKTESFGTDYQFKFWQKLDFSTSYNSTESKEVNLITNQLTQLSKVEAYSIQTRIPWNSWAFTPRYERSETDTRDSARLTNDLVQEIYSLQIYGDINRPFGLRLGRREIGFANRMILNSTLRWDKKRSNVNPQTSYLDVYSFDMTGDYTLSKNFRLALGGNILQEVHHPDFDKLDKFEIGLNATLTIQF